MHTKEFDVSETISYAFRGARKHIFFFLGLSILILFIHKVMGVTVSVMHDTGLLPGLIATVLAFVFYFISLSLYLLYIKSALRICEEETPRFSDFRHCLSVSIKYFFATIMYSLMVGIGLLFLIIPGVILGIKFAYFPFLILEENMGPIQAFKRSSEITMGSKGQIFLLILALFGLNVILVFCYSMGMGIFTSIFSHTPFSLAGIASILLGLVLLIATFYLWVMNTIALARSYKIISTKKEAIKAPPPPETE